MHQRPRTIVKIDRPAHRFELGRVWATANASLVLKASDIDCLRLIDRHVTGDWGDVSEEERRENDVAVRFGYCLLSVYRVPCGFRIWVFTEGDRSNTVISLREEHVTAVVQARTSEYIS